MDLTNADLTDADLSGASLSGAYLDSTRLKERRDDFRRRTMKNKGGFLDAIAFFLSVPFGVAGFALRQTVCQQPNRVKSPQDKVQQPKETESRVVKVVSGGSRP